MAERLARREVNWADIPDALRGLGQTILLGKIKAEREEAEDHRSDILTRLGHYKEAVEHLLYTREGQVRIVPEELNGKVASESIYHRSIDATHVQELGLKLPEPGEILPTMPLLRLASRGMVLLYHSHERYLLEQADTTQP